MSFGVDGFQGALAHLVTGAFISDGFTPLHYVVTTSIFLASAIVSSLRLYAHLELGKKKKINVLLK
jgi:hypothetical protein